MMGKLLVQLHDRLKKIGDDLGKEWELTKISKTQLIAMALQKVETHPERSECPQAYLGEIEQTVTFAKLRDAVCHATVQEAYPS